MTKIPLQEFLIQVILTLEEYEEGRLNHEEIYDTFRYVILSRRSCCFRYHVHLCDKAQV